MPALFSITKINWVYRFSNWQKKKQYYNSTKKSLWEEQTEV